jgi:hypothetical protein
MDALTVYKWAAVVYLLVAAIYVVVKVYLIMEMVL